MPRDQLGDRADGRGDRGLVKVVEGALQQGPLRGVQGASGGLDCGGELAQVLEGVPGGTERVVVIDGGHHGVE
ncbi:hypothetical protein [Streptomyces durocortorensis]|uniref:Uncharacterized protein n=1 Tax=Streptomyces durocortorensis TaxID=2811104 RepID=A0ABS2HR87_9ACTN|nr:hypothetical protein [Streptomyces durocortorensis]MBM7052843.1 hypothetical protein [Streptomyces durocortorensis]